MDIENLLSPISYEERIVVFFDVLGWKSHVRNAGDDPQKIGHLALIPKILRSEQILEAADTSSSVGTRITSFSDCCVLSIPYCEESLPNIIYGLSNTFVGCALMGFLLRAGVTIGKVHHENDIVFGPAMNMAYELESKGIYPRIIIDPNILSLMNLKLHPNMLSKDKIGSFVNLYEWSFIKSANCQNPIPTERFLGVETNTAKTLFTCLHEALLKILDSASEDKHRERANWPYSKVRQQFKQILSLQ